MSDWNYTISSFEDHYKSPYAQFGWRFDPYQMEEECVTFDSGGRLIRKCRVPIEKQRWMSAFREDYSQPEQFFWFDPDHEDLKPAGANASPDREDDIQPSDIPLEELFS